MKKLLDGIAEFRRNIQPAYRLKFAGLAIGQSPDCLFIACSDSRVVPNVFASTDPGDLFVVRNVGNLVPPCDPSGRSVADLSEAAAIEYALLALGVRDIVVCGHSECGAMRAMLEGTAPDHAPNLREWLALGALPGLDGPSRVGAGLPPHDRLSQLSVLQQVENLRSYPVVRERVAAGTLGLHAWWFDLHRAEVLAFDRETGVFSPLGEGAEPSGRADR